MNKEMIKVKRALISVSDKTGVVEFARALAEKNIEIISTGGTSQLLREANIPVRDVADVTHFPEMMDGRLKTLHPKIHGGILGLRDLHAAEASLHDIHWIDLVVVNLYPFSTTIRKPGVTEDEAIENIDIGGPTMIRAAAKNRGWVGVIVDPNDYTGVLNELSTNNYLSYATREQLTNKAFRHTAEYDTLIYHYFTTQESAKTAAFFPAELDCHWEKLTELRYGENPHQKAAAYQLANKNVGILSAKYLSPSKETGILSANYPSTNKETGILSAKQHQGKPLSYNNLMDGDAALTLVNEFKEPACVIVKHANPCGVATDFSLSEAFKKAFHADSLSAFGGIVALNKPCDAATAEAMAKIFFEVIIAPSYSVEALTMLATKPNLRVLEVQDFSDETLEFRSLSGGMLIQEKDRSILQPSDLKVVTAKKPTEADIVTMLFAWPVLKQMKSNAILIAKDHVTLGMGVGQVSRVDAVEQALKKAGQNAVGAILASDAFFPFRDSIDLLAGRGLHAIIQPGGSVRDEEVIAACDEHGIAMVFTGIRCFKH